MEYQDQKVIALEAFREIYDSIDIKVDFVNKEISKNGIEKQKNLIDF